MTRTVQLVEHSLVEVLQRRLGLNIVSRASLLERGLESKTYIEIDLCDLFVRHDTINKCTVHADGIKALRHFCLVLCICFEHFLCVFEHVLAELLGSLTIGWLARKLEVLIGGLLVVGCFLGTRELNGLAVFFLLGQQLFKVVVEVI